MPVRVKESFADNKDGWLNLDPFLFTDLSAVVHELPLDIDDLDAVPGRALVLYTVTDKYYFAEVSREQFDRFILSDH